MRDAVKSVLGIAMPRSGAILFPHSATYPHTQTHTCELLRHRQIIALCERGLVFPAPRVEHRFYDRICKQEEVVGFEIDERQSVCGTMCLNV